MKIAVGFSVTTIRNVPKKATSHKIPKRAFVASTRAATNDRIERMRSLVADDGLVTFAPTRVAQAAPAPVAQVQPREELRLALSEPVVALAPMPAPIEALPISYGGSAFDTSVPYRDPHLELAELFLAHAPY